MKLLFLCKRRPQRRDLVTRSYGRFFYIPRFLASRGHQVYILVLSYKNDPPLRLHKNDVTWISRSMIPWGPIPYVTQAMIIVNQLRPDWIVGFSDTYYGILAVKLAESSGAHSVIDAYDNYESYIPWLKPLHHLWRRALSRATVVTAAGPMLAEYMTTFRPGKPVSIVPMAADPGFQPLDKAECRRRLGLPADKRIIGYCGAIHRSRGVDTLFRAYENLKKNNPLIDLALTGRKQKGLSIPSGARWLGYLPDEQMPLMLNSLDILLVLNQLSDFGKFSYPVKLYEAMRCQIPVVATNTPPVRWILGDRRSLIANPRDDVDLARKVVNLLGVNRYDYGGGNTWEQSSVAFEQALLSL
jgi:glycosyltransferase involved in cell wall biosynthesis